MEKIEELILCQFEFDPYSKYTLNDFEKIILQRKDEVQNIEVFIGNDSLADKILIILDHLAETEYVIKYKFEDDEPFYMYYPDKFNHARIVELENLVKSQESKIEELQQQIEKLSLKIDKPTSGKRFWII